MADIFVIILLIILTLASILFSASETAIIALNKIKLRHMVSKGVKRAQGVQNLTAKPDKFIATILIGNNFVNIAMSAIITALCISLLGFHWGTAIATFITALIILIFCEITPKILAAKHALKIAFFVAPSMDILVKFLSPLTKLFIWISNSLLKMLKIDPPKKSPLITEEELKLMIEVGKDEGVLSDEERKMLHRIFEFGDTKVCDVMAPKDKIIAVNTTLLNFVFISVVFKLLLFLF